MNIITVSIRFSGNVCPSFVMTANNKVPLLGFLVSAVRGSRGTVTLFCKLSLSSDHTSDLVSDFQHDHRRG